MNMKTTMVLEQSGLIIELFNKRTDFIYVTYQACTHGGWSKYLRGYENPQAHFESKSEIIADANKLAKYYNAALEVLI